MRRLRDSHLPRAFQQLHLLECMQFTDTNEHTNSILIPEFPKVSRSLPEMPLVLNVGARCERSMEASIVSTSATLQPSTGPDGPDMMMDDDLNVQGRRGDALWETQKKTDERLNLTRGGKGEIQTSEKLMSAVSERELWGRNATFRWPSCSLFIHMPGVWRDVRNFSRVFSMPLCGTLSP